PSLRRSLLDRSEVAFQFPNVAVQLDGRLADGYLLDRGSDRVDLDQFPPGDRADACSAKGLGLHEAQTFELAQRLPHGYLARLELLREPRLDEALAGLVLPTQDARHDRVLDVLP